MRRSLLEMMKRVISYYYPSASFVLGSDPGVLVVLGELTHLQSCGILRAVGVVLASVFAVGGNLGAAGLIYIKRFATGVSIHTHCEIALYPRSSSDVMSENRGVAQNPIHMTTMELWMSTKARRRRLSSHLL